MKRRTILAAVALVLVLAATARAQPELVKVIVNGKELVSDVPPQVVDGRTMIPIRAISEGVGWKVFWDAETRTVTVRDAAFLTEHTYKRALNAGILYGLMIVQKTSTLPESIRTKDDLTNMKREMDQHRAAAIGFMRLRPPVTHQEVHSLACAFLVNSWVAMQATVQMKEIELNIGSYDPAQGIATVQATGTRARSALSTAKAVFDEIVRLMPEANDALKSNDDQDIQWFAETLYAVYPESWPK